MCTVRSKSRAKPADFSENKSNPIITRLCCAHVSRCEEPRVGTPPAGRPRGGLSMRIGMVFAVAAAAAFLAPATSIAQEEGKQDFTLVNETGYTISGVYVSPS